MAKPGFKPTYFDARVQGQDGTSKDVQKGLTLAAVITEAPDLPLPLLILSTTAFLLASPSQPPPQPDSTSRPLTSQDTHFEHGPDVVQMSGARKRGFGVAHSLHQGLGCLRHLLHLQVIEQPPLLLTSYTCKEGRDTAGTLAER